MAKADGGAQLGDGPGPGAQQAQVAPGFDYAGITLSAQARLYDTWLLRMCRVVDGVAAYRMIADSNTTLTQPYISTVDTVATGTAEGATSTEQAYTFGAVSANFITFRSLQTVSNELLQDSDAMQVVAASMAGEISEAVQAHLLTRIGEDLVAAAPANRLVFVDSSNPAFVTLRQLTNGIGGAGIGTSPYDAAAGAALWNCEERKRIVMASHNEVLERFYESNSSGSSVTRFQSMVMVEDRVPCPIYGVPWYTDKSMPLGTTTSATPHVLIFDPQQVLLVSKGLVIRVDTESRMAYNQSVIHATFRAAGALMNPRAAVGSYLSDPDA